MNLSILCLTALLTLIKKCQSVPQNCINVLNNATQLPPECNQNTSSCNFPQGLMSLITNSTDNQNDFLLCIVLNQFDISIGLNVKDQFDFSLYIQANSITFGQNYSHFNDYSIILKSNKSVQLTNLTWLSGEVVWIQAALINISNAKIQNISSIQSQCSCQDQKTSNCQMAWNFSLPLTYRRINQSSEYFDLGYFGEQLSYQSLQYNSVILYSSSLIWIEYSTIISSIVSIVSNNISIYNSLVSTSGNGFPAAAGYGCGYFDQTLNQLLGCTGSGGSYGGFGGNSWPDNCNLMISRTPYQSNKYPLTPGSGGGFFVPNIKEVSSGGGIINIQAQLIQLWHSVIQSNGKPGTQGGGGGSGGSVALDYNKIEGNSNIAANGGAGKSSGGGGRMWIWNHNWKFQKYDQYLSQFKISASGGLDCIGSLSCGQNGSIATSPCQPGHQLNLVNFICQFCPLGYYQSTYGYSQCSQCLNSPAHSIYTATNKTHVFSQACVSFKCVDGYTMVDQVCYSSFMYSINFVGGINTIIAVGIIIAVLIGYLIIIMVQKLTTKDIFMRNKQRQQSDRKMHFKVQDIPFHEKRIYFSGLNTPKHPWYISDETKQSYRKYSHAPLTKLDSILNRSFKQINQICKYSKTQKIILMFLKFYYYPMYKYLESKYKERKSQQVEKLIIQTNKKLPQSQNLGIKFHVQPYFTVGCIQIFNYTKNALDFYIQDYFPIYFQLQKMPLGGYCLDLNQPLMRAFISQIDQKSQQKRYQHLIIQLNQLLRNTEQLVPILNHLWMMTQYNPMIQVYLFQPQQKILGIQKQYSISKKIPLFLIFSSQNINKHHFIYEQPLPNVYHDKVDYFSYQYNFRQEVLQEDRKAVFWEIQNTLSQKVLSWTLGIITIFLMLQFVIQFFILVFIAAEKDISFGYGVALYFAIGPLSDFFMVALAFKLILTKSCLVLANSIYFTLGNIFKFMILVIIGLIANIGDGFNYTLIQIIFFLWVISLVCIIITIFLQLMLHPHYSKHINSGQSLNQKKLS